MRNVHVMLHKALTDAAAWGYVAADGLEPAELRRFLQAATGDRFYPAYVLAGSAPSDDL